MAVSHIDRKLSRHEVQNKTILIADANMNPVENVPHGDVLLKTPEGNTYEAEMHDSYTDGKFYPSLKFPNDDFYYKEGLSRGRRVKMKVDDQAIEGDKLVIEINLYQATN